METSNHRPQNRTLAEHFRLFETLPKEDVEMLIDFFEDVKEKREREDLALDRELRSLDFECVYDLIMEFRENAFELEQATSTIIHLKQQLNRSETAIKLIRESFSTFCDNLREAI